MQLKKLATQSAYLVTLKELAADITPQTVSKLQEAITQLDKKASIPDVIDTLSEFYVAKLGSPEDTSWFKKCAEGIKHHVTAQVGKVLNFPTSEDASAALQELLTDTYSEFLDEMDMEEGEVEKAAYKKEQLYRKYS